jgi:hypothetical protein
MALSLSTGFNKESEKRLTRQALVSSSAMLALRYMCLIYSSAESSIEDKNMYTAQ